MNRAFLMEQKDLRQIASSYIRLWREESCLTSLKLLNAFVLLTMEQSDRGLSCVAAAIALTLVKILES